MFDDFYKAVSGGTLEDLNSEIPKTSKGQNREGTLRNRFLFALNESAEVMVELFLTAMKKRAETGRAFSPEMATPLFKAIKCAESAYNYSVRNTIHHYKSAETYTLAIGYLRTIEHLLPNDKPSCKADRRIIQAAKSKPTAPAGSRPR